jgi:two-component system cell cycle sensor histidine kinase/response regulator CckA
VTSPVQPSVSTRSPLVQRSLLFRIVLSFFVLSSLIVVSLTVFSFWFLTRSARGQQVDRISAIATIKEEALNRWVKDQVRNTESIARLSQVEKPAAILCAPDATDAERRSAHLSLATFLSRLLPVYPEFHTIFILSAIGGQIVSSTDASAEGQYRVLDSEFLQGMRGTAIQNVHPSPITVDPTMSVSTPLLDPNGMAYGVIVVRLNLDMMDRIIQDRTGLGQTGEAYLVDRFSTFVSGSRFGRANYPRGVHSYGIDAALKGGNGSGSYLNYAGIPVLGAFRWIRNRDLALLVEVRQQEAFHAAWVQTLFLIASGLALVLVLAFGVFILARRLAQPIIAIQRAAQQVSTGNLDAAAPVMTHDEVGDLAMSFNRMTVTVKGLYEELKRKEEHFRTLIESSMDLVIVLNADGSFSFGSPSVQNVLGYGHEELATMSFLGIVHPEDSARWQEELSRLGGEPDAMMLGIPLRIVRKEGMTRTLEVNVRNLLEHPAVRGFVVNARDVTERRQLEEKLLQAQKMEAVGRLAGGVAHDFNNLLTVVIGYADALSLSGELPYDAREYVGEIGKAAARAAELTQQLLAYSRKQVLQPRTIDLNALLAGMNGMLKRLIGEDVVISMRTAPDLQHVRADPSQISQVVMNLAANARDAMPDGGAIVFETRNTIVDEACCRRFPELTPGSYVTLAVSDTGCGMDEETRGLIFDPFFTTKGVGKGTGLGLATVYGIVTQSGGHITVQSGVGQGSTFTVYLPVTSAATTGQKPDGADRELVRGVETILVVEDEEPLRLMVRRILERAGYVVATAARAEEAIACAAELSRVDLLLSDVILPGMNGKEIAVRLRREHPSLKVLFISGYAESVIGHHGVLPEATAFLQKPFSPAALARKVREVLDGR